jgi:hypothetical protein
MLMVAQMGCVVKGCKTPVLVVIECFIGDGVSSLRIRGWGMWMGG